MSIRPILLHPDPRLRKLCEPVGGVDDDIRRLVADMFETMYAAPGIGLAAPQIGVLRRVLVMDCAGRDSDRDEPPAPIAMIDPEILWASDERRVYNEGCLSLPDQFDDVTRPSQVRLRWLGLDGATQEGLFDGVRATCAQHEIDHLNGRLFIDHLGPVKRAMITSRMKKLKRERAKDRVSDRASDRASDRR